jgi:hypothetical protein
MTSAAVDLLRDICGTRPSPPAVTTTAATAHPHDVVSIGAKSSSASRAPASTCAASGSVMTTAAAPARRIKLIARSSSRLVAPPVTLREMIFRDGQRFVRPLGREQMLKGGGAAVSANNNHQQPQPQQQKRNRPSSSSRGVAANAAPATRAELLDELAAKVAMNQDFTDVLNRIKKLPPPKPKSYGALR